jgi:hypothetical protein
MCFGYSYSQTIIQAKMMRSILLTHDSLNGNRDIEHPDQESKRNITKEQWERAKAAVDTESFFALPDMMGCPGCRDEPADWITVKYRDGTTKSVMCNRGYCPTTDTKYEIKTALAQGTHGDVPLKRPQSLCPTLGQ